MKKMERKGSFFLSRSHGGYHLQFREKDGKFVSCTNAEKEWWYENVGWKQGFNMVKIFYGKKDGFVDMCKAINYKIKFEKENEQEDLDEYLLQGISVLIDVIEHKRRSLRIKNGIKNKKERDSLGNS